MLAAILAAAMSTLASSLNSSASALVNDFYLSWQKEKPSDLDEFLKLGAVIDEVIRHAAAD